MPYIDQQARQEITDGRWPLTAGELSYVFFNMSLNGVYRYYSDDLMKVVTDYLRHNRYDYQHMNDIIGALYGTHQERIRRGLGPDTLLLTTLDRFLMDIVAPYEDTKRIKNGDLI
jgi:hypothetical protein